MQKKSRRSSVDAVLDMFRANDRKPENAYNKVKEMEGENLANIIEALDQLSDVLCQATYFSKAYEILSVAIKDIK